MKHFLIISVSLAPPEISVSQWRLPAEDSSNFCQVGPDQTQHLSFCTGYYSHGRFDVSKVAAKLNYQLALVTFFYIRQGQGLGGPTQSGLGLGDTAMLHILLYTESNY